MRKTRRWESQAHKDYANYVLDDHTSRNAMTAKKSGEAHRKFYRAFLPRKAPPAAYL